MYNLWHSENNANGDVLLCLWMRKVIGRCTCVCGGGDAYGIFKYWTGICQVPEWGKSMPGKCISLSKNLEMWNRLACLGNCKEAVKVEPLWVRVSRQTRLTGEGAIRLSGAFYAHQRMELWIYFFTGGKSQWKLLSREVSWLLLCFRHQKQPYRIQIPEEWKVGKPAGREVCLEPPATE